MNLCFPSSHYNNNKNGQTAITDPRLPLCLPVFYSPWLRTSSLHIANVFTYGVCIHTSSEVNPFVLLLYRF